jgi:hypothetical protein
MNYMLQIEEWSDRVTRLLLCKQIEGMRQDLLSSSASLLSRRTAAEIFVRSVHHTRRVDICFVGVFGVGVAMG